MRILILRKSSLGDIIHALPAFHALRRAHPTAQIHWVVARSGMPLLGRIKGIDAIHELTWRNLMKLRSEPFDLTIDFQGLLKTAAVSSLTGRRRLGFARGHTRERLCQLFYTDRVVPQGGHVIEKNLSLAEAAGALRPAPGAYEFGDLIAPEEQARVDAELAELGVRPGFVLMNPGAAWVNKRWDARKFGETARRLDRVESLVTYGPGERSLAEEAVSASMGRARLAFQTTFMELGALAKRSSLMITGDTGPMHLACAVGTPILGLFAPTSPYRNGPWKPCDRWLIADTRCDFCYKRTCVWENCIDTIDVDRVVEAAREMLGALERKTGVTNADNRA